MATPLRETALLVAAWVVVTVVLVRAGVTERSKVVWAEMTTVNRVATILTLGVGPLLIGLWLLSLA